MIIGLYGKHLTNSYTAALKCTFKTSIAALANTFSFFFLNKISIIRSSFPSGSRSNVFTPPKTREVLHNLTYVTDDEVRCFVLSAPCKSSDLDPIPTSLVKDCIDILVTPIVSIVNLWLSKRCFLSHFKSAPFSPLLKKPTLNRDDMKNYRPVSNLSVLPEIHEKVVASCLNSQINSSHTSNDYQSAYRKVHSTKTTLLKIHNDILSSMEDGRVTALTLLTAKPKLKPDKTEFLLIGNERQQSKYLSMLLIELLGVKTYIAKSAHNLGVIFNKNFNFRSHISAICSSCIYHIRDLRRIRRHLDLESAKLLANALVCSRLDYCNSFCLGLQKLTSPSCNVF